MKHPVEVLKDEHRQIEKMLDAVEQHLPALGHGEFEAEFWEKALDFFRNFADGCHHAKEEELLFPALQRHGVPSGGGPVAVMLHEHTIGRACLAGIRNALPAAHAGSTEAVDAVRQHAENYIHLLRTHIWKEDNILFQMAVQLLPMAEADQLGSAFADESNPRTNAAVRERYARLLTELTASVATVN